MGLDTTIDTPDFSNLPRDRLETMRRAGAEVLECHRVLRKGGLNLVGEVLREQGTFYKTNHYPKGDVYDRESHSKYYYHAHRENEHGHFHTFLRGKGMPEDATPAPEAAERDWPSGEKALAHIVAISMDKKGQPLGLFMTNRWVTGETWFPADQVAAMMNRFAIDHAYPSWPVNRWITAMLRLYRPQIEMLLAERDAALEARRAAHPGRDVFEDRDFEVLAQCPIDLKAQIGAVADALGR